MEVVSESCEKGFRSNGLKWHDREEKKGCSKLKGYDRRKIVIFKDLYVTFVDNFLLYLSKNLNRATYE